MKRLWLLLLVVPGVASAQLVNENFEGTGAPTGWTNFGGSANFDYTASPLNGSQSLYCNSASGEQVLYQTGNALNNSEVWFRLLIRVDTMPASLQEIITMSDSGAAAVYRVFLTSSGVIETYDGSTIGATVSTLSTGTIYNIWGHYKKGTGSDAVLEVSFDTPGQPRPNSGNKHGGFTNGNKTTNATSFALSFNSDGKGAFDDVVIAATDIFSGATPTASPTPTPTPTNTPTATPTNTPTATPGATATSTPTPTASPTVSPTPSLEVSYGSAE